MTTDRPFDPADYGVIERERRERSAVPIPTTKLAPPWVLLRRLKSPPTAHVPKRQLPPGVLIGQGVVMAECGVMGMPLDGHEGREVPACPQCNRRAP